MILQLTNSKGRITFKCFYEQSIISGIKITAEYEGGNGYYNQPEHCFMHAACTWNDNPSCKVDGEYKDKFLEYCKNLSWLNVNYNFA